MEDNPRDELLAVGTSQIKICNDTVVGQFRKELGITNVSTSGQIVTLRFTPSLSATAGSLAGIVLYPTATYSAALDARYTPWQKGVWVIADGANAQIAIHEIVVN